MNEGRKEGRKNITKKTFSITLRESIGILYIQLRKPTGTY